MALPSEADGPPMAQAWCTLGGVFAWGHGGAGRLGLGAAGTKGEMWRMLGAALVREIYHLI